MKGLTITMLHMHDVNQQLLKLQQVCSNIKYTRCGFICMLSPSCYARSHSCSGGSSR